MTTGPVARYRLGVSDRVRINGEAYRPLSSDGSGHVLQLVNDKNVHRYLPAHEIQDLLKSGALECDEGFFSASGAVTAQSGKAMSLSRQSRRRREEFLHRVDTVERLLTGYKVGTFTKSPSGYVAAAKTIADEQHQAALDAYARQLNAIQEERQEEVETEKLLRKGGSRVGMIRHDSRRRTSALPPPPMPRKPVGGRTLAGWVGRFERSGNDPLSLLDNYDNCGLGSKLDPAVDAIIDAKISQTYLTETRPSMRHTWRMIELEIARVNHSRAHLGQPQLRTPSYRALARRIKNVPAFTRVRSREGQEAAAAKFAMSSGGAGARLPMERVEIDEWMTHIFLIDGKPVQKAELSQLNGRRFETARVVVATAICCATRYVPGISVSFTPSPENVKNALRMALSDRSGLTRAAGATSEWGQPTGLYEVYTDTGTSFDSTFQAAVIGLGGQHVYGPAKQSQLRPTIERFFRTIDQRFLQHFSGRTFSNTQQLGAYPAQHRASLTVEQFQQLLIQFIVDEYHHTPHEGLHGKTPHQAWQEGIRQHELPMPPDRNRLIANLGARHNRKLSGEGIYFADVPFTSSALQDYRLKVGNATVDIAVDHNDIGQISAFFEGKWHALKSPIEDLEGVPLAVWQSTRNQLRRTNAEGAVLPRSVALSALERIQQTSDTAILDAQLGAIQPSTYEIERDEGKLRIGWNEPQAPMIGADLADLDLEESASFIAFGKSRSALGEGNRVPVDETTDGDDPYSWMYRDD